MSPNSMDSFAPPDSTRVPSSSPSSTSSSSFDSIVLNSTVPFALFPHDYQPQHNASWSYDDSSSNYHNNITSIAYSGGPFGSPVVATQQAVGAAVHQCSSPPIVQMHHLSLSSSSPIYAPGPVTYANPSLVAPRPVPSSSPLIGCGWAAPFQPPQAPILTNAFPSEPPAQVAPAFPLRPPMQAKIPPEKGRKSFPCLHPGCGMKFPKRNALVQHMRSHTGERPEVCDWCSRAFSLKCNLRRHYRTCKKKKALEATAMAAKKEPSSSPPPPFEHSPSPGASSPSSTVVPMSHDSPPANMFAPPPNLWGPDFSFTPSHQASTLVADMDCHALFPAQFATAYSHPTLIQAQF